MTDTKRQIKLRSLLEAKKNALLAELRKSMGNQRAESSRMSFEIAQDDGDKSVEDHGLHVQSAVQGMKSELLDDIEQALAKLDEGSYGTCEECSAPIPLERLAIQPSASYCVACQEDIDRISKRDTLWNKEITSSNDASSDYLTEE
jgi:DnaK suppressor protein